MNPKIIAYLLGIAVLSRKISARNSLNQVNEKDLSAGGFDTIEDTSDSEDYVVLEPDTDMFLDPNAIHGSQPLDLSISNYGALEQDVSEKLTEAKEGINVPETIVENTVASSEEVKQEPGLNSKINSKAAPAKKEQVDSNPQGSKQQSQTVNPTKQQSSNDSINLQDDPDVPTIDEMAGVNRKAAVKSEPKQKEDKEAKGDKEGKEIANGKAAENDKVKGDEVNQAKPKIEGNKPEIEEKTKQAAPLVKNPQTKSDKLKKQYEGSDSIDSSTSNRSSYIYESDDSEDRRTMFSVGLFLVGFSVVGMLVLAAVLGYRRFVQFRKSNSSSKANCKKIKDDQPKKVAFEPIYPILESSGSSVNLKARSVVQSSSNNVNYYPSLPKDLV